MYVGKLASKSCPVIAMMACITTYGTFEGPLFTPKEQKTTDKDNIYDKTLNSDYNHQP